MKLLIITQSVDKNNPVLGFFHRWIEEFAKKFESITVICLEKGECSLPINVKVLSLGKETGKSRIKYLARFYKYIWQERKNYDAVFVHMNQEYIILGWKIWWLLRKPVYMWRNHHAGNLITDIAAFFCKKVFCTSKFSYTAKYKKTILMPVGVDMEVFSRQSSVDRKKNSILFLGRIAPVKKPHLLVEALAEIKDQEWSATIVGDALDKDQGFYQGMKDKVKGAGLADRIIFQKGVPNTEAPKIYNGHEIFVNLSSSGMYDKTIFEAMACGCLILASNENLRGLISDDLLFKEGDKKDLSSKLEKLLSLGDNDRTMLINTETKFTANHSLAALGDKLYKIISAA
jgi:glycosyltransferase involved in cell wall biosynthesis